MMRKKAKRKAKAAVARLNRICEVVAKDLHKKYPYYCKEAIEEMRSIVNRMDFKAILGL